MFSRIALILTLILSLGLASAAPMLAGPSAQAAGDCAPQRCVSGCCADKACCAMAQERQHPSPTQNTPRVDFQFVALHLRVLSALIVFPPQDHAFALRESSPGAYARPPRAVGCIWRI